MKPKLLLACSAGGHLTEMRQLEPFYSKFDHAFLTFRRPDTESLAKTERVHFVERPARNPIATLKCIKQTWDVIRTEKPDLVLATGADVSVPACYLAKLSGKKVVFIESFCRPIRPGISGQLAYPIADLFLYQWKALAKTYSRGQHAGFIFGGEEA